MCRIACLVVFLSVFALADSASVMPPVTAAPITPAAPTENAAAPQGPLPSQSTDSLIATMPLAPVDPYAELEQIAPAHFQDMVVRQQRLKAISETAYQQFPKNKEIAHVYASALSMWGNERGALTSVKDGVAAKVRDVATAAEDYQVLGRAHFVLPYVPLILSWPDKKLADKYLNMALQKNPRDLYNYFFLAELRFDQKRYADALDLIDRGLSRGIRTNYFLEDKRGRWELKELQKKINAKLDKK